MSDKGEVSWNKIKRCKVYAKYSNFLLVPWFFIGLYFSFAGWQFTVWFILFIFLFKIPIFYFSKQLVCPVCRKPYLLGAMSLVFASTCASCGSEIGKSETIDMGR